MDLKSVLAVAWKRRLTLVLVVALAVAAAGALAFTRTKMYRSTATIALTPNVEKGQGFVASDDLATLLSTYAAVAESSTIKSEAAQILGHPLRGDVSASSTAGTGILKISATTTSPAESAASAQALSEAFQQAIASNKQLLIAQVVDPPAVPGAPVQPRPPLIIATGLVLGLALGIALVLVLERWFDRVESVDDVTAATGLTTLGYLPRHRALKTGGPNSLIWRNSQLLGMQEAVRALRTSLQFSMRSTHDVIQITSSSQGEGKSTIAANLAVAMAGVGHPVLLVDADFRAPRQHSIFGLLNGQGLSTMMSMSGEDLDVPIQATAFKNLGVLTSGPLPPNPTEVMASRIESAIARLRELEWAIIIDTPPVLPVSDARLVAPKADLVLLVAVAGRTKPANLRTTVEQLLVTQATLAGVVLNQAKETSMYEGYGYYRALEPIEFAAHD